MTSEDAFAAPWWPVETVLRWLVPKHFADDAGALVGLKHLAERVGAVALDPDGVRREIPVLAWIDLVLRQYRSTWLAVATDWEPPAPRSGIDALRGDLAIHAGGYTQIHMEDGPVTEWEDPRFDAKAIKKTWASTSNRAAKRPPKVEPAADAIRELYPPDGDTGDVPIKTLRDEVEAHLGEKVSPATISRAKRAIRDRQKSAG